MKTSTASAPVFRGTVAELAGKMELNGQTLSLQDVQFLTRIGRDSFAKAVDTAPSSGERGGKRATIWEISPSAKLQLRTSKEPATKPEKSNASAPSDIQSQVADAVQKALKAHGITGNKPAKVTATTKRKPGRKTA